ncbi:MAG: DNA repair protein RecO [Coriobacteriales bacterium]|jgi:DNA repair protein RecO (recombination protein O)|nr:DNA repair protein RecO [Coriobacteriales bacterium]
MPDISTTILVLRKTKLGESDLIITGFSSEGHQVRAVAKGARRPGSKLGARLELYCAARVLLHKGRSLDIVTEAEGLYDNGACRVDVLHSAAAAVIVEMLDKVSADGDCEPRLFPLALEALRCVGAVPAEGVALIAAAAVLKMAAQLGFRPSLRYCVLCGDACGGECGGEREGEGDAPLRRAFSFEQGGVVCAHCLSELPAGSCLDVDIPLIDWVEALITTRFIELERHADAEHELLGEALLKFAREWLRFHLVNRLKSLDFLLTFHS